MQNKQYLPIEKVRPWSQNPKIVTKDNYKRLRDQIKRLGQYKPLLINGEGDIIGGNSRYQVYKELGFTDVWVSQVDFREEGGVVRAYIDGEVQEAEFESVLQAMVEYSTSDNDEVGRYQDDQLAELIANVPQINMELYRVNMADPIDLEKLMQSFAPSDTGGDPNREEDKDTMDDKLDQYLHGSIRQIVMYLTIEKYNQTIEQLEEVCKINGLENNTEAILKVLDVYMKCTRIFEEAGIEDIQEIDNIVKSYYENQDN